MSCRLSADDLKSKRINSMFAAFIRSTIKTVFLLCIGYLLIYCGIFSIEENYVQRFRIFQRKYKILKGELFIIAYNS